MKKLLLLITLFIITNSNKTVAQNAKTFNLAHDYPTYLDIKFIDQGKAIGEFEAFKAEVTNISSSEISYGIEFTINDNCGNSQTIYWPGGLNQKVGSKTAIYGDELVWKCKEYRINNGNKFGIASVYCRVFNFKNLTEEANKYKEEQKQKQQKLDEEKSKREKIAFDKEVQQIKDQREKERLLAEKEENKNSTPNSTSYYNNTTTTSKPKQPTAEETKKATEIANQQINANRIANETRQKQIQEQVNSTVDAASQLAMGIYSNIAAERERKEENERIDREQSQQRRKKGEILLNNFLKLAYKGDEFAIKKTIEGFKLTGKPVNYYNEILDDYFSNEPKEYLEFLENVQQRYNSPNAKSALIEHYENVTENFKWVASIHLKKAIGHTIFGGVIAAAGLYGGELIYKGESQKADENNEVGDYTLSSVVKTVGILGGACYVVSGLVHFVRIGQANNDEHNKKAKTILINLKDKGISFQPTYNFYLNNFGFALNYKF